MSFGREDLVLEGAPTTDDVDRLIRFLQHFWPAAVAAQADREIERALSLHGPGWTTIRHWKEFFICENAEALQSWIDHGAIAENANTMVHVLVSPNSLTAVVDQRTAPLGRSLTDIFRMIARQRAASPPLLRREAA